MQGGALLAVTAVHGMSTEVHGRRNMEIRHGADPAALTALLNDLLQLDHDAVSAYGVALRELDSPDLRTQLDAHLRDHERHIEELGAHIERVEGVKMPVPHLTGAFKMAVQAAAGAAATGRCFWHSRPTRCKSATSMHGPQDGRICHRKYWPRCSVALPMKIGTTTGQSGHWKPWAPIATIATFRPHEHSHASMAEQQTE
jgi:hypothetical protein